MAVTTKIPRGRLFEYFDALTKRFLRDGSPEAVEAWVVEPEWGLAQPLEGARLLGITYDRKKDSLEFALDSGDHRFLGPGEVWVVEESDGFVSAVEVVRPDGAREVVSVKRVGLRRMV
jgi:uncharacterized protein DUF5335